MLKPPALPGDTYSPFAWRRKLNAWRFVLEIFARITWNLRFEPIAHLNLLTENAFAHALGVMIAKMLRGRDDVLVRSDFYLLESSACYERFHDFIAGEEPSQGLPQLRRRTASSAHFLISFPKIPA
jgi:hypothetical protein